MTKAEYILEKHASALSAVEAVAKKTKKLPFAAKATGVAERVGAAKMSDASLAIKTDPAAYGDMMQKMPREGISTNAAHGILNANMGKFGAAMVAPDATRVAQAAPAAKVSMPQGAPARTPITDTKAPASTLGVKAGPAPAAKPGMFSPHQNVAPTSIKGPDTTSLGTRVQNPKLSLPQTEGSLPSGAPTRMPFTDSAAAASTTSVARGNAPAVNSPLIDAARGSRDQVMQKFNPAPAIAQPAAQPSAKPSNSFKEEFAKHKGSGKDFPWNGKSYSSAVKGSSAPKMDPRATDTTSPIRPMTAQGLAASPSTVSSSTDFKAIPVSMPSNSTASSKADQVLAGNKPVAGTRRESDAVESIKSRANQPGNTATDNGNIAKAIQEQRTNESWDALAASKQRSKPVASK